MSIQNLDFGTGADGDGEHEYTAWPKVQANFEDLYAQLAALGLNGLADVVLTSPSNGQVLKYNGTEWVNAADATGGGGGGGLSGVVSPLDYGAAGDGVTEDGDAVLAAAATGQDVFFPPDMTFLVNGKTIIPSANQRFFGGGRLKKTTTDNDLTPAGSTDAPKFFQIHDVDGVTVEGIEFEYAFSGTYSLVTPRLYGVTIQNAERTTIRNNYFAGYETPIFIWKNSRHTQVIGNRSFLGVFGIATGGDGASGTTDGPVEDTIIAFNTFAGAISEGIDINWDTQRCLIYGNNVYDNSQFQFEEVVDIGGGECFDIWVVNNTIDAGTRAPRGVLVKLDTKRVLISGNRIFNGDSASTSGAGVIVDGLTTAPAETTNVTIKDNDISGFYIGVNASRSVEDITISGNRISDVTLRGVFVDTTGNARVGILDNELDGTGSTGDGILINATSDFTISGNRVRGFGSRGISSGATASHGIISNNTIYENAERGILINGTPVSVLGNRVYLNGTEGILLNGVDSIVCSDNRIYDNGVVTDPSYGLNIAASSDHCVITDNYVTDSRGTKRQNGINIASTCDDCVFIGNRSHANKTTDINGVTNFTNSVVSPTTGTLAAFVGTALSPPTSDGAALGTTSLQWSDLFLAEGGVINWDNGDVSITQTGNVLSFAGASTRYEFDGNLTPSTTDGAALGTTALQWSDIFLANGGFINWNNGTGTLVFSGSTLTFNGCTATSFTQTGASPEFNLGRLDTHGSAVTVGNFDFEGKDSAGNTEVFARLSGYCQTDTNTSEAGQLRFSVMTAGTLSIRMILTTASLQPTTNDLMPLGTATASWSDLFLADGGVINWNNGNMTLTHASGALTVAGGSLKLTNATGGLGYATGSGGAVTQITSRTTGVTLNTVNGAITLVSAAGSTTPFSFTVTNSAVAATDVIIVNQKSGTDKYDIDVTAVAAGSFQLTLNTKSGTTTEQPVFNFAVIKAVAA